MESISFCNSLRLDFIKSSIDCSFKLKGTCFLEGFSLILLSSIRAGVLSFSSSSSPLLPLFAPPPNTTVSGDDNKWSKNFKRDSSTKNLLSIDL